MTDIAERISALEIKVRQLEDQLEIYQLLARYGPAVDSCSIEATASLWVEEGSYDFGLGPLEGAAVVGALVDLPTHRDYVDRGCTHAIALPLVAINGDQAVATGNSRVYASDGDGWKVERASANRWELIRTVDGWRVKRRINRLLNGSQQARDLFRQAVDVPL